MIGRLSGIVEPTGDDRAIVDVHGVGYLVNASTRTLARLDTGAPATLEIETFVREDRIVLYGFRDGDERRCFRWLTSVQGVGPRVALAILSVLSPDELVTAVVSGDKRAIARADGVGARLAQRIVAELEGHVTREAVLTPASASTAGVIEAGDALVRDAVSALVNLGYERSRAWAAVTRVRSDAGDAATLDGLIRIGLKELAS